MSKPEDPRQPPGVFSFGEPQITQMDTDEKRRKTQAAEEEQEKEKDQEKEEDKDEE